MNTTRIRFVPLGLLLLGAPVLAQPPGITAEMIGRQLPLEGAPLAIPGPYEVVAEEAFGAPGYRVWRPSDLSDFRRRNLLPVMAWGNGGCAIDATRYGDFLSTIASHGFVVISTVSVAPAEGAGAGPGAGPGPGAAGGGRGGRGGGRGGQATSANMDAAFDWADAENARAGSPLNGKIATDKYAAMGQSCGGFMSLEIGADPRVGTIGMFNSGVNPPGGQAAPGAGARTTDALANLHGPVLFINGGEVDFMYGPSRDNFDRIENLPAFYGARENAGHTATVFHPGGGEYANVASNWLLYVFKDDREAAKMFVGEDCGLCVLQTWETASKRLE